MGEKKDTIKSKNGDYEVIRRLGSGYTGEVYLVKDPGRKEPVALKLLNPEAYKEGQLDNFKREFTLLNGLHHPHACRVYDFGYSDNKKRYFFTQELVQGTDLYTYAEKLSVAELEEIFVQISDALGFIHANGLIHFDIKGDNILVTMVDGKPLAKIVDFGLAAPSFDTPENIAGTVRYISPEMVTKKQSIDYRADLYSLGIVLYRMLAGTYPNQGSNMKEVLNWHIHHESVDAGPLESKGVPTYLIEAINKLTRPIPTDRFSSAAVIVKFIELHSGKTYATTQKKRVATLMEEGPLVARDKVMFKIRAILNKLSKGESLESESENEEDLKQTLVLFGPHGSGKSRLIKEARYISQLTELNTYMVRGEVEGQDVESFYKALDLENIEEGKDSTEALLERQPFCVMVDNLDKCNKQVKDFITGFAGSLYSSKFMGEPLKAYLVAGMTVDGPKDSLPVTLSLEIDQEYMAPFAKEDITQYIRLATGEANPSVNQVNEIMKFSGGVPELVKTAMANLDPATGKIAGSAQDLFVDRIKGLDAGAKKVLGYIALSGKPLTRQQMIQLAGLAAETALTELIRDGFISHNREGENYEIATGAIVAAAEDALSEEEKRSLAMSLLECFEKERPKDIDAVVKFALIAADSDKAAEYLVEAAEVKEKKAELEDAFRYYGLAIDKLPEEDERLPEMHRKVAKHLLYNGQFDEALAHLDAAARLDKLIAEDLISKSWICRLKYKLDDALKYLNEATELTDKSNVDPMYLRLLNEEGYCYIQMGKPEDAIKIMTDTNKYELELPEEERKKVVNNNLGLAQCQVGKFDEAISFYKDKFETFKDDKHLAASILNNMGYVYQQAGRLTEGLEAYKWSLESYSSIGDRHSSMSILSNMVCLCQSKALFTDALEYVKESINLASRTGSEKDLAGNFLTLGTLYVNLGLEDVARRYLNEASKVFQKLEDKVMQTWVQYSFAYLYKNLARYKEAMAYLDNVIKSGNELKINDVVMWASYAATEIKLDEGELDSAKEYLRNIETEWGGTENANETTIKIEFLRCKVRISECEKPSDDDLDRLEELAVLAEKLELREIQGEIYHEVGGAYQKWGDHLESAKFVAKAKEIIDDIAGTLSEEYRESFLKQEFRKDVFEDSIRLKDYISQLDGDEEPELQEGAGDATTPATVQDGNASEGTVNLPAEQVPGGGEQPVQEKTSVFKTTYVGRSEPLVIGQSAAVSKIREMIEEVKDTHASVLICGEHGTGKHMIADVIHESGIYKDKPFKKVEVEAYSDEYLEDLLWGRVDESLFEAAGDGTVFFMNIEWLPSNLHKKLAEVIKKREFVRLKDKKKLPLRARIIASANASADKVVKNAKLHKKLFKQLAGAIIEVPPLRERTADIPMLIDHFLSEIDQASGTVQFSLTPGAIKFLMHYSWPGNIRELEQVLRNSAVVAKDGKITEEHVGIYIIEG